MPERSSKRKARRDSVTSSLGEPEATSLRTENVPSISDRAFSELSEKIEKSVTRRIRDAEVGQREILKMIENLSSKIDSLSGQPPNCENLALDSDETENQASLSRPSIMNELHPSQGQHSYHSVFPISLTRTLRHLKQLILNNFLSIDVCNNCLQDVLIPL